MPGDRDSETSPGVRFLTVDEEASGQRLDNFLSRHLKGVPRARLYRALRKGEVRVNKGRVKPEYRLVAGDLVRLPPLHQPR
ncbi:MAG: S4 domain-containing protein, partial [Halioglobus sp.]